MSEEEVNMRLKPHEVRIVNAVRRMGAGQVRVIKDAGGKLEVETNEKLQTPGARQSSGPEALPLRLRD